MSETTVMGLPQVTGQRNTHSRGQKEPGLSGEGKTTWVFQYKLT